MPVTRTVSESISSDTKIFGQLSTKTIDSDAYINFTTVSNNLSSNTNISKTSSQDISSVSKIVVNQVSLKLYESTDLINEIGTATNPIMFSSANAGDTTLHPDNPFLLYNDKDGTFDSVDAKNIQVEVLEMSIVEELVGVSDGTASQVFSVAYSPVIQNDSKNVVRVKVGVTEYTEVSTFTGSGNTDTVFLVDYVNGTITFGNGVNGNIPPNTDSIYVTYTPDTTTFGVEARDDGWLYIQSSDVDRHDRVILLSPELTTDTTHIQLHHVPIIPVSGVQGVYLKTDPNRLGTNYFTGGSYNNTTGIVILGIALPGGTTDVLVDYKYTIADDSELTFTSLGQDVIHSFTNPIPSKNAKKLNLAVVIPSGTSPTNGVKVKFRLRFYYTEY